MPPQGFGMAVPTACITLPPGCSPPAASFLTHTSPRASFCPGLTSTPLAPVRVLCDALICPIVCPCKTLLWHTVGMNQTLAE